MKSGCSARKAAIAARAWFGAVYEVITHWVLSKKPRPLDEAYATLRPLLPWLALAGVALASLAWRSRHIRNASQLPAAYAKALRLLARRGLRRGPATTARDFAARVRAVQTRAVAAAFDTLTEAYLAERFGGRPPGPAAAALDDLRASLRRRGAC